MRCRFALGIVLGLVCLAGGAGLQSAANAAAEEPTAVVERVKKLGGEIRYDAQKNIIGVDLLECRGTDADIKLLARWETCGSSPCGAPKLPTPACSNWPLSPSSTSWCWKTPR